MRWAPAGPRPEATSQSSDAHQGIGNFPFSSFFPLCFQLACVADSANATQTDDSSMRAPGVACLAPCYTVAPFCRDERPGSGPAFSIEKFGPQSLIALGNAHLPRGSLAGAKRPERALGSQLGSGRQPWRGPFSALRLCPCVLCRRRLCVPPGRDGLVTN